MQSNYGGESRPFTKYILELCIQHKFTCSYSSHKIGTVERKHKHIVEMGLTMLSHVSMYLHLRVHNFSTLVHDINRLSSTGAPKFQSPYYTLYHKLPNYDSLKVFGCACFPHTRPYNKHKLDFRSQECVFLGTSSKHKGFKCLTKTRRIYISKDVIFHESTSPYSTLFPSKYGKSEAQLSLTESLSFPTSIHGRVGQKLTIDTTRSLSKHGTPNIDNSLVSVAESISHASAPLSALGYHSTMDPRLARTLSQGSIPSSPILVTATQ